METLFNPIKINNLDIPNRFAMAPMTRNKSPDGIPGQNVADYYERRAKGGVGLIITCLLYTSPSPRDRTRSRMPSSA